MKAIIFGHEQGGSYVMDSKGRFRFITGYTSQPVGTEVEFEDTAPFNRIRQIAHNSKSGMHQHKKHWPTGNPA